MLEICLNILGTSIREIEIGNTGHRIPFSELGALVKKVRKENGEC